MKRKSIIFLFVGVLGLSLAGCGSSSDEPQKAAVEDAGEDAAADDAGDAAEDPGEDMEDAGLGDGADEEILYETEEPLAPIKPSDYLVQNATEYVTLGNYEGISIEQPVYEITDDLVQDWIQEELEMNADEVEQERPAKMDDIIYADISYTVDGETYEEEDYFTTIGYEEFGAEFDENLIGVSAGETKEFSITYADDDDDVMMEWAGETVDFTVKVTSVCALDVPEYNDEYVQEAFGFDSTKEYEDYVYQSLVDEYSDAGYSEAVNSLVESALALTEFSGYPEELYESVKDERVEFYVAFSGAQSIEEIYDLYGMTEDELEEEVMDEVNRRLLVSAYCLENGIEVTEDEYVNYLEATAMMYGNLDAVSIENVYGRMSVVWTLYETKFADELYEKADITEVKYDAAEMYNDFDEDWDDDDVFEIDSEAE